LDASDDIATVTLGDSWRMPTYAEIDELANKCHWQWDEAKKGYQDLFSTRQYRIWL
jgi:hypothetical protein